MGNMIKEKLISHIKKCSTLLGVGPMSLNCVDSVIEISNHEKIPLMLIASRRQIDSKDFGGGYVNNWSTEEFSKYVFNKDKLGLTYLAKIMVVHGKVILKERDLDLVRQWIQQNHIRLILILGFKFYI